MGKRMCCFARALCNDTQTTLKMQIPEMVSVSRLVVDIIVVWRKENFSVRLVAQHTLNFSISLYPFVVFDIAGCYWCCQRRRFTSFTMPFHAMPYQINEREYMNDDT